MIRIHEPGPVINFHIEYFIEEVISKIKLFSLIGVAEMGFGYEELLYLLSIFQLFMLVVAAILPDNSFSL